jgi:hypothetical protein
MSVNGDLTTTTQHTIIKELPVPILRLFSWLNRPSF